MEPKMNETNVVGRPVLMTGAVHLADQTGHPGKNEFSNSDGDFRTIVSSDEVGLAAEAAADRLSRVFPCDKP